MKKIIFLFLTLFTLLFSSCGDYQDVTFIGVDNVKIVKLSQKGAEAEITARINNPNNTSFVIYPTDLNVTINGINAGIGHLSERVRIKAHSEQSYTFKIKSDFSNLSITDLPKLMTLAMSKNVKVGLKGNLKAGKLFVKRSFPVDVSQSVPLGSGN